MFHSLPKFIERWPPALERFQCRTRLELFAYCARLEIERWLNSISLFFCVCVYLTDIRSQLNEQLRCLDVRMETQISVVGELQDFFRRRAEVELDYSKNLDKLSKSLLARHKEQKQKYVTNLQVDRRLFLWMGGEALIVSPSRFNSPWRSTASLLASIVHGRSMRVRNHGDYWNSAHTGGSGTRKRQTKNWLTNRFIDFPVGPGVRIEVKQRRINAIIRPSPSQWIESSLVLTQLALTNRSGLPL